MIRTKRSMSLSSEAHFDGLDEVFVNFSWRLLCVHTHDGGCVLCQDVLHESAVLQQLFFDVWVLVLWLVLQSGQDCLIFDGFTQYVVILVGYWIETPLLKLLVDQMVTHIKCNHKTWLHVQFLQHADLVNGRWSSLKDPAVSLAVWCLKPLPKAPNGVVIRDHIAILENLTQVLGALTLSTDGVLDKLVAIYVNQLIFLG